MKHGPGQLPVRPCPAGLQQYVGGRDLAAELARRGRLDLADTVRAVTQMCSALDRAHAAGIVHRDLKPANILLEVAAGGWDRLLLGDFGIARLGDGARPTAAGFLIGTPSCIAPELVEGTEPAPASDVYAVGVLAVECATGTNPFAGGPPAHVLERQLRWTPPLPPEWPRELAGVIAACLSKNPADRPAAAEVTAVPPAVTSRAGRRRHARRRAGVSVVTVTVPGAPVTGGPGVALGADIAVVHGKRGDLKIYVAAPNGTKRTVLMSNAGDSRPNFAARIDLAAMFPAGTPVNGIWKLGVSDTLSGTSAISTGGASRPDPIGAPSASPLPMRFARLPGSRKAADSAGRSDQGIDPPMYGRSVTE